MSWLVHKDISNVLHLPQMYLTTWDPLSNYSYINLEDVLYTVCVWLSLLERLHVYVKDVPEVLQVSVFCSQ